MIRLTKNEAEELLFSLYYKELPQENYMLVIDEEETIKHWIEEGWIIENENQDKIEKNTIKKYKIISNKIKCNHCGDIIESKYRHDYVDCKCGRVSVDGGKDYLKRRFTEEGDYEEISETEEIKDE